MIKRALIIGGTGKLADTSRWVARRGGIHTQNIVLGRIATSGGHRWLTKAEISQGVMSAQNVPETALVTLGA